MAFKVVLPSTQYFDKGRTVIGPSHVVVHHPLGPNHRVSFPGRRLPEKAGDPEEAVTISFWVTKETHFHHDVDGGVRIEKLGSIDIANTKVA